MSIQEIESAIVAARFEVPLIGTITDQALEDRNAALREQDKYVEHQGIINGRRVTLVLKRLNQWPEKVFINCNSKQAAKELATAMGLGLEPVIHPAHNYGQHEHYHPHGALYVRFDDAPFNLCNYHFTWWDMDKERVVSSTLTNIFKSMRNGK